MKNPFVRAPAGLFAIVGLATIVISARAADMEDPISLFAKIAPVFSHDRCTGCHGRVNPDLTTGTNHSMGQFTDTRDCIDCHTEAPGWKTRPDLAFFNKNTKQLCLMQSEQVEGLRRTAVMHGTSSAQAVAGYLSHLASDTLIGAAFIGKRGGATSEADRPGMSRNDFVAAARAWLDSGAGCGSWKGTITQKETFGSNYTYPMPGMGPPSSVHVNETAARDIMLVRENGATNVTVTAGGAGVIVQTLHMVGPNGPCTSVQTSDSSWTTTTPKNARGELDIQIKDDGSYTIRFRGPEETGNGNSTGTERNDCGIQFPPGGLEPAVDFTWHEWYFTIRCPSSHWICQLYDPDNRRLSGSMTRTVADHMDAADPQSWLTTAPVGISRSDDNSTIPVTVTTTWDLTLEN